MRITFEVLGEIKGKQRPKLTTYGGFAHAYTPKETINYESKVLFEFKQKTKELDGFPVFFDCPLFVTIIASFSLSKSDYGKKGLNKSGREKIASRFCTKHIDTDNIAKIVMDALNGVAYKDDKQVAGLLVIKQWTEGQERLEITLEDKA